ncbi:TolC family protein [Dyadobacter psychrotolerans]|uniref:TolC family protein n=1 Tax=Dyadobacter psychrotolerans TaxID=2541721 RepID=A0A4R5D7Q4_9BACT|nr:TolC family protein [Dyadobacter psychrotolerans]TDE08707.1 TolC family protein [Dyadobacter psychrotolerans]
MHAYIKYSLAVAVTLLSQVTIAQKSLTLGEARKLALEQSKKVKSAQFNIDAAKAAQEGTQGLNKPAIDGSIAAFHVGKPLSALLPAVGVSPSLTVTQPIYAGGKIRLGQSAAAKGVEIQEKQKALTETEVLLNVDKGYWQIVSVQEKIKLANKFKALLESLDKELTNSFDAGMIYKNDLLRVQVQRNETEMNLIKASDGLLLAKMNLAQIIGLPADADLMPVDSVTGSFDAIPTNTFDSAVEGRPEIALLKDVLQAQELQKKMLQADLKPTIGVLAGGFAGFGKKMNIETGGNTMASYFGMLSVNIPIWDWGQKASKVKEQGFKIRSQQIQMEETKELISLEIQNAYLQLNQAAKKIELSGASLQQAEENLRLSNDRFKAGTVTGQDVLEAQTLWAQANSNIIDARIEYKVSEAVYKKAIGENKR